MEAAIKDLKSYRPTYLLTMNPFCSPPFCTSHICCLTRCHWFLLVISVVCALEYIKHSKTAIASKFGFIQVKFKLFRERLQYAV